MKHRTTVSPLLISRRLTEKETDRVRKIVERIGFGVNCAWSVCAFYTTNGETLALLTGGISRACDLHAITQALSDWLDAKAAFVNEKTATAIIDDCSDNFLEYL